MALSDDERHLAAELQHLALELDETVAAPAVMPILRRWFEALQMYWDAPCSCYGGPRGEPMEHCALYGMTWAMAGMSAPSDDELQSHGAEILDRLTRVERAALVEALLPLAEWLPRVCAICEWAMQGDGHESID